LIQIDGMLFRYTACSSAKGSARSFCKFKKSCELEAKHRSSKKSIAALKKGTLEKKRQKRGENTGDHHAIVV